MVTRILHLNIVNLLAKAVLRTQIVPTVFVLHEKQSFNCDNIKNDNKNKYILKYSKLSKNLLPFPELSIDTLSSD